MGAEVHIEDVSELEAAEAHRLDGVEALHEAVLQMARGAGREIALLTPSLGSQLYGSQPFCDAVTALMRGHAYGRMRLLITSSAGHRAARLLSLAHRLPSRIEIRRAPDELKCRQEMLIVDQRSYLLRGNPGLAEAEFGPNYPARARQLAEQFDSLWNQSPPDRESRRLSL